MKTSQFPNDLQLRALPGGRDWEVLSLFRYYASDGSVVWVPHGFVVNGASIPRCFWRVVGPPMTGLYREASVIHDWLWQEAVLGHGTFRWANWVFLDAMRALGVARWRRWLMWLAVSANGRWQVWRYSRKRRT